MQNIDSLYTSTDPGSNWEILPEVNSEKKICSKYLLYVVISNHYHDQDSEELNTFLICIVSHIWTKILKKCILN